MAEVGTRVLMRTIRLSVPPGEADNWTIWFSTVMNKVTRLATRNLEVRQIPQGYGLERKNPSAEIDKILMSLAPASGAIKESNIILDYINRRAEKVKGS